MHTPPLAGALPFVGRERELALLSSHVHGAAAGRGGMVLLAGEAGIGKTRLVEEAAGLARERGLRVLWGRCYEGEGAPAFWPWVQILRAAVRDTHPEGLRLEMGPGAADIATLVPEVHALLPGLAPAPVVDPAQARFRLFDAVSGFLRAGALREPRVLILDDLHWADLPSLLLLEFLARDLGESHLLVLGAYRNVEVVRDHPLARSLGELARCNHVERLHLRGLTSAEMARFAQGATGVSPSPALLNVLMERSDGNPLYVRELARLHLSHDGPGASPDAGIVLAVVPETVRELLGRRLEGLSAACAQALAAAAVIGREFEADVLARTVELSPDALLEVLEEAELTRIIEAAPDDPGRLRFTHALIRESLYENLAAVRRTRLHLRVAQALEALHGGAPALPMQTLARLALHYRLAGPAADARAAVAYARRAGEAAAAIYAWEAAAAQFQGALDILERHAPGESQERCGLLLRLGDVLLPAGHPHRVAKDLAPAAFALAEAAGDHLLASRASQLALVAMVRYGGGGAVESTEYRHWAELADRYAPSASAARVAADIALSQARTHVGDEEEGWRLRHRAYALALELGEPETIFVAALDVINQPAPPHRRPLQRELALALAGRPRDGVSERTLSRALLFLVTSFLDWGDRAGVDAVYDALTSLGTRSRDAEVVLYPVIAQAALAIIDGRLAEALATVEQLVARADELGAPALGRNNAIALSLRPLLYLGRGEEMLEIHWKRAEAAGMVSRKSHGPQRALVLAHLGRHDEARIAQEEWIAQRSGGIDSDEVPTRFLCILLEIAVLREDREAARRLLPRLAGAEDSTTERLFSCVARHLGGASAMLGDAMAARRYYARALEVAGRLAFRPEAALTHLQIAELLAQDGAGRQEALEHLEAATREFQRCGMQPALRRAAALRGRLGMGHRSHGVALPSGLTEREVEVLRLLAAGRSYKAIAEALVLSPATVHRHTANIYAKIGAANRTEAATYAMRHDIALPEADGRDGVPFS